MSASSVEGTWLRASVVMKTLTQKGEIPRTMEDMLFSHLRNGDLRARASAIWEQEGLPSAALWKLAPEGTDGLVPTKYWRSEVITEQDRQLFAFRAARFAVTIKRKPLTRAMMKEVEFLLEDLVRLLPAYFGKAPAKRKRGRPVEIERRDAGWLVILDLAVRGKLRSDAFSTIEELRDEIIAQTSKSGRVLLGENQARDIAGLALTAIRSKEVEDGN